MINLDLGVHNIGGERIIPNAATAGVQLGADLDGATVCDWRTL